MAEAGAAPAWPRPLEGVRVVDFSLLLPGPYCTHLLTEMGATTVKVEPPGGDPMRHLSPEGFAHLHRGQQSVCVDARTAEAREFVLRLVADADVVVEGFRPGAMHALGLGFEDMARRNPHLVYLSLSAYGQSGPYARRPGHDVNVIAAAGYFAGTLDLDDATMQRPRLRIADYFAAMLGAFTVAALLRTPRHARQAQHVDASLFEAMAAVTLPAILSMSPAAAADPTLQPDVLADVAIYATADGRAVAIAALEDKFWPPLVEALEPRFPQIADDAWRSHAGRRQDKRRLAGVLGEIFASLTLAEVSALLPYDATCWSPVLRGTELLADPQVLARGLVAQAETGRQLTSAFAINRQRAPAFAPSPELGADTARWRSALGLPDGSDASA